MNHQNQIFEFVIALPMDAIAANVAADNTVSVRGAKNKTLAGLIQKNKAAL